MLHKFCPPKSFSSQSFFLYLPSLLPYIPDLRSNTKVKGMENKDYIPLGQGPSEWATHVEYIPYFPFLPFNLILSKVKSFEPDSQLDSLQARIVNGSCFCKNHQFLYFSLLNSPRTVTKHVFLLLFLIMEGGGCKEQSQRGGSLQQRGSAKINCQKRQQGMQG